MTVDKRLVYLFAIVLFVLALLPVPVTKTVYRDEVVGFSDTTLYRALSPYIMCINASNIALYGSAYNYNITYNIPSALSSISGHERYTDSIVTRYTVEGVSENTSRYSRYLSVNLTPDGDVARFTAYCTVYNLTAIVAKIMFRVNVYSGSDMLLHSVATINVVDNYSSYVFAIHAELNNYTETIYTVNVEVLVSGVFVIGRYNIGCYVRAFPSYYYKGVPVDTRSTNNTVKWAGTSVKLSSNSFESRRIQNIVSTGVYTSGIFGDLVGETISYQSKYEVAFSEVGVFKSFIVNSSSIFTESPCVLAKVNRCSGSTDIIETDYSFSLYEVPLSYDYDSIGNCQIISVHFDYAKVFMEVVHTVVSSTVEILPWWATL